MKIVFVGDVFCGCDLLKESPDPGIVCIPGYYEADFRVGNLESPLSDNPETADKCTLHAPSDAAKYLNAIRIDAVSLANNHIQDKGDEGIFDTFNNLQKASIRYFGAGKNINEARRPLILEKDGTKAAILGYCDHDRPHLKQIKVADADSPGVAPIDHDSILSDVERVPPDVDRVVLYMHWGREHTWFPPKEDMQLAKRFLKHPRIDLIIGTHAHLPQGILRYKGKKAFMGLGNFLFPNFYLKSPTQIDYGRHTARHVTHGYHRVYEPTHKRWHRWCRRSLVVFFDTDRNETEVFCSEQGYLKPFVRIIKPFARFNALTRIYSMAGPLYPCLSKAHYQKILLDRRLTDYETYVKQRGIIQAVKKASERITSRKEDKT